MAKAKTEKTIFRCIFCGSTFALDYSPPDKWMVKRYAIKDHFKYVCSSCGAFIYPADLCAPNQAPDGDLFYMFAACENAFHCYLHDLYAPDCEKPVLKPKCLAPFYRDMENILESLLKLEKKVGGKRERKESAPVSNGSDKVRH